MPTFQIATGTDDANTLGSGASYPPAYSSGESAGSAVVVSRTLTGGTFEIRNGLLRWDTSPLVDSISVSGVQIILDITSLNNADTRNLTADWYDWGTSEDSSDYTSTAATTALNTALSGLNVGANTINLTDFSGINVSGYSSLRLHISGTQPTGNNSISFTNYNTTPALSAQLVVNYLPYESDRTGKKKRTSTFAI